jgi:hypothetical protein
MVLASSAVSCRSCGAGTVDPMLDFGAHPDPDWLLDPLDPTPAPEARVELGICATCGLVQLLGARPDGPDPPHGHAMPLSEGDPWVGLIERSLAAAPRLVLDIDGSSGLPAETLAAAGLVASAPSAGWPGPADLILVGHALAHEDDLNGLLSRIEAVLARKGLVAIDFHHVLGLAEGQFDVVSHAHRSYLSLFSVDRALEHHGLVVVATQRIGEYGGTIRLLAARRADGVPIHQDGSVAQHIRDEELTARINQWSGYERLARHVDIACSELVAFLDDAVSAGRTVAGYGAASRGTALLNFAGVGIDRLPFVVLAPSEVESRKPDDILILPWPLAGAIVEQLSYVRSWGAACFVALPHLKVLR